MKKNKVNKTNLQKEIELNLETEKALKKELKIREDIDKLLFNQSDSDTNFSEEDESDILNILGSSVRYSASQLEFSNCANILSSFHSSNFNISSIAASSNFMGIAASSAAFSAPSASLQQISTNALLYSQAGHFASVAHSSYNNVANILESLEKLKATATVQTSPNLSLECAYGNHCSAGVNHQSIAIGNSGVCNLGVSNAAYFSKNALSENLNSNCAGTNLFGNVVSNSLHFSSYETSLNSIGNFYVDRNAYTNIASGEVLGCTNSFYAPSHKSNSSFIESTCFAEANNSSINSDESLFFIENRSIHKALESISSWIYKQRNNISRQRLLKERRELRETIKKFQETGDIKYFFLFKKILNKKRAELQGIISKLIGRRRTQTLKIILNSSAVRSHIRNLRNFIRNHNKKMSNSSEDDSAFILTKNNALKYRLNLTEYYHELNRQRIYT